MMRRTFALMLTGMVLGCASPVAEAPATADLTGRVSFGTERRVQGPMDTIGVSATVSLIQADTNETVRTTLTDKNGRFVLSFGSWRPTTGTVYYLEAIKGLGDNRAGNSAARVRTFGKYVAGGWSSLAGAVPGSPIWLTDTTTAIAVIASHLGTASVSPDGLIGKLAIGVPDSSLSPSTPDSFSSSGTGIPNALFHEVYGLVTQALNSNGDPMDRVSYNGASFNMKAYVTPGISAIVPPAAPVGAKITLYGTNFASQAASNSVSFNGVVAQAETASATQLSVTVPGGATSGPVTVVTGDGPSGTSYAFTVILPPSGTVTAD